MTNEGEGKFYWIGELKPYQDLEELHRSHGVVNITWDDGREKYLVDAIVVVFPDRSPMEPVAGIVFKGHFNVREGAKIQAEDILELKYVSRIGTGYSREGSLQSGSYMYEVREVEWVNNVIDGITVTLDTPKSKGTITFKRSE